MSVMGRPVVDLVGKTFGHLLVLERVQSDSKGAQWLCRCECGNEKIIRGNNLVHGRVKSCGWQCSLRATKQKESKVQTYVMPSPHVYVPDPPHFEWLGDEQSLIAMTEKETASAN